MLQFAGGAAADAAVAADDVVILELVDHAFVPPLADRVAELEFDDGLGHGADGDEEVVTPKTIRNELKTRPACESG